MLQSRLAGTANLVVDSQLVCRSWAEGASLDAGVTIVAHRPPPIAQMLDVDIANVFADAEAARYLVDAMDDDDDDDTTDVASLDGANTLFQEAHTARASIVRLPDGDVHLCGRHCRFGAPDREGNIICPYTGFVVARVCEERTDASTGRSNWSADPDVNSGGAPYGAWRCKRDPIKASEAAFLAARAFEKDVLPTPIAPAVQKHPTKRGARCVGEVEPTPTMPKRQRTTSRDVATVHQCAVLIEEASNLFGKLLLRKHVPIATRATLTPKVFSFDTLYYAALRKYLKESVVRGIAPSSDDVHNIALAVQTVLKRQQCATDLQARESRVGDPAFRKRVAQLVVAMWTGACATPYLKNAKRGGYSFRPFAIGVLYGFKRGVGLADGTVLVPRCSELTAAMPTAKMVNADALLKSMHSSSHKGLCTLHRAIASVTPSEAKHLFAPAVAMAACF